MSIQTLLVPLLLMSTLVTACVKNPAAHKPDLQVPVTWTPDEGTEEAGVRIGATEDLRTWWRRLNDPVLSGLIVQALTSNLDWQQALARLRQAHERRVIAGAARKPTLSAQGSAGTRHAVSGDGRTSNTATLAGGLDASWELDLFGSVAGAIDAASADHAALAAEVAGVRVSLAGEVGLAFVEYRTAGLRIAIHEKSLALQEETLRLLQLRREAGLDNAQELEQAVSALEQTRAQLPMLGLGATEARHRLELLLGLAPGALRERLASVADLPTVPATVDVGIPADVLRQRPDVRAAERRLAAETARAGVARAQLYPSFKLTGSFGVELVSGNGTGAVLSLLGGITAPLFDGGRLRAQLRLQTAVCDQALHAYRKAILTALQEVQDAMAGLARQRARMNTLERALEAARRADTLSRQNFETGVFDFQPVLETGRTLLTLEDAWTSARAAEVTAVITLYKALGGGWSPDATSTEPGQDNKP